MKMRTDILSLVLSIFLLLPGFAVGKKPLNLKKDARCEQTVEADGYCDMSLGEHVVFDKAKRKCVTQYYSGCRLISMPKFDLETCRKVCE